MEIQASTGALKKALDTQEMGAQLINSTMEKMNANSSQAANTDAQKAVLSAAYADKGIGTNLDVVA